MIEILLKYVAKQHGITESDAKALLFDSVEGEEPKLKADALTTLIDKDKARVEDLKKTEKTTIYDEAFNNAKKEVLLKEEKKIAKKYGIELGTLKMEGLVSKILEEKGNLNQEEIKKNPIYLELERSKNLELETLKTEHQTAIGNLESSFQKKATLQSVKKLVGNHFTSLKPILSKDQAKAENQKNNFANIFEGYDYEQNGEDFLILQDGKRIEDGHGNPMKLQDLVQSEANKYFDFEVQGERGNAGNKGGGGATIQVPKSQDEFEAAFFNAKTPEERATLKTAWDNANGE